MLSDLHLGSRFCQHQALARVLDGLPEGADLILNGDVLDHRHGPLPPPHAAILDRLRDESRRRSVIWIYGNHDDGLLLDPPGDIRYVTEWRIGRRILLAHGHRFDLIMPAHRWFIRSFRAMHHLRIVLGAEAVHVAVYARRWDWLYRVLRRHVQRNAVRQGRQAGVEAVACGHTHYVEDHIVNGIRYINTGSWTEWPVYGLWIEEQTMRLRRLDDGF